MGIAEVMQPVDTVRRTPAHRSREAPPYQSRVTARASSKRSWSTPRPVRGVMLHRVSRCSSPSEVSSCWRFAGVSAMGADRGAAPARVPSDACTWSASGCVGRREAEIAQVAGGHPQLPPPTGHEGIHDVLHVPPITTPARPSRSATARLGSRRGASPARAAPPRSPSNAVHRTGTLSRPCPAGRDAEDRAGPITSDFARSSSRH